MNLDRAVSITPTFSAYFKAVIETVSDFCGAALPIAMGAGLLLAFWAWRAWIAHSKSRDVDAVLLLWTWTLCSVAPSLALATYATARYFKPAAAPLCLAVAYTADKLWRLQAKASAGEYRPNVGHNCLDFDLCLTGRCNRY